MGSIQIAGAPGTTTIAWSNRPKPGSDGSTSASLVAGVEQGHVGGDVRGAQQGGQQHRLVLAVAEAALQRLGRRAGDQPPLAELDAGVAHLVADPGEEAVDRLELRGGGARRPSAGRRRCRSRGSSGRRSPSSGARGRPTSGRSRRRRRRCAAPPAGGPARGRPPARGRAPRRSAGGARPLPLRAAAIPGSPRLTQRRGMPAGASSASRAVAHQDPEVEAVRGAPRRRSKNGAVSRTVTICSTTAPPAGWRGAERAAPCRPRTCRDRRGSAQLSVRVAGSSRCSAPSAVITRARISGCSWCQGSHSSSTSTSSRGRRR